MNLGLDLKKFTQGLRLDEEKQKCNTDAMQLFVLSNISRMADFYGNLDA